MRGLVARLKSGSITTSSRPPCPVDVRFGNPGLNDADTVVPLALTITIVPAFCVTTIRPSGKNAMPHGLDRPDDSTVAFTGAVGEAGVDVDACTTPAILRSPDAADPPPQADGNANKEMAANAPVTIRASLGLTCCIRTYSIARFNFESCCNPQCIKHPNRPIRIIGRIN